MQNSLLENLAIKASLPNLARVFLFLVLLLNIPVTVLAILKVRSPTSLEVTGAEFCHLIDFDGDNQIDTSDVQKIAGRMGNPSMYDSRYDLNSDGIIDQVDYDIIWAWYVYGASCSSPLPTPPTPVADVKANSSNGPITISYNSATTITWTSSSAVSCVVTPVTWRGINGSQSTGGLTSSQTYTLRCYNHVAVLGSDSVVVNVSPPPTANIKANNSEGPISISSNTSATLSWTSGGVTNCTVSPGGWAGTSNTGVTTGNLTTAQTYTLSCSGTGGNASDSVTVNVTPVNRVSADIKANGSNGPIYINSGASATISWSSNNATSCSVSPGGWTGTSGSTSIGSLTSSKTYTVSCSGAAGSASDLVKVNIGTPPKPDGETLEILDLKITVPYLVGKMKIKIAVSGVEKEAEVSVSNKSTSLDLRSANLALNKEYSLVVSGDKIVIRKMKFTPTLSSTNLEVGDLILGDLNQDNAIDSSDQVSLNNSIASQTLVGDLNADKVANSFDWAILLANLGKKGD